MSIERSIASAFRRGHEAPQAASGPDSIADDVLSRAEAAVDALSAEYPQHAMRDIAHLIALTERAAHGTVATRDFDEISRIAHDMRGQGSIFGYPLMTRCAGSLCRATRTLDPRHRAVTGIVRTHVAALYAILRCGAGTGDRDAASVASGLELLVESNLSPREARR